MGMCMLTWARSPGRILPGLPTPGPPDRPRLLVWLSRLWYSMGDCNAGARQRTEMYYRRDRLSPLFLLPSSHLPALLS